MTRTKICSHFFRSCNLLFIFFGWCCCCCYWFPIHTYIITSPPSSFRTQWILHSTVKRTCCAVSVWVGECWMVRLYFFSFLFSFVCARAKKQKWKILLNVEKKNRSKCTQQPKKCELNILCAHCDDLEFFFASFLSYLWENMCLRLSLFLSLKISK